LLIIQLLFGSEVEQLYLMYLIGCEYPTPAKCQYGGVTCDWGNNQNGESGISLWVSKTLLDWNKVGMILKSNTNGTWDCDTTNPSPLIFPNSTKVLLAYRGCPYNCDGAELINMAIADSYQGPYVRQSSEPVFQNGNEDPFIWRDPRGNYHLLLHSLEDGGGFGGPKVGRHAFSRDGIKWTFNSDTLTYNVTVHFTDGTVIDYYRRERPQLFFDQAGNPLYLSNGVQEKGQSGTYTLIQPLRTAADLEAAAINTEQQKQHKGHKTEHQINSY